MSSENKNTGYTARDIEKYFSGKLTALQMHQMEKDALDDPFLSEAMEGYGAMSDKEWEKQLALARLQMAEAGTGAKVVAMHRSTGRWWKAAAAVMLIGSGATLTYLLTSKNNSEEKTGPQIAKVETNSSPAAPAVQDNTNPPAVKENDKAAITTPSTEKEKRSTGNTVVAQTNTRERYDDILADKPGRIKAADSAKQQGPDRSASTAGKSSVVISAPPVATTADKNVAMAETVVIKENKENTKTYEADGEVLKRQSASSASRRERSSNIFFNAQVVAADNSPLPFSNVSVKSGNFETYADVKGNFRLFSTDSLVTVEVKSVGYQPRTYSLRSNQPMNRIILLENEQAVKDRMGEVGLNSKIRRASVLSDSAINVEPKDGWDNYNTYVANNLDITDEMLKNEFHGEVELSFDVKANGTISNVRVNKSLGPAYDEAAKRLILQGPQWKVKKGRKTSASVKVKF